VYWLFKCQKKVSTYRAISILKRETCKFICRFIFIS